MAEPSTIDQQKVFNSATEKFKNFVGGVDNVKSTENMNVVYENMAKLFESFTNKVLVTQGSDSQYVLNTVYKGLDENLVKLLTNEDAVKKLVEAMKGKMENKTYPSSSTAKPTDNNFTLNEVIIDFMDELHTSILKIQ